MKKRFSFSRLLHHDKLMMLVSLILAVVIWSSVVYSSNNQEEREITGVPVSIVLNDYASETLKLRIVSGANATATVKVKGERSVIGKVTPQDITVTADTGNIIKEGTYVLQMRASSTGDYSIVNLVGSDGTNSTVTITCDVWRVQSFPVTVEMPNLTVTDAAKYQFGAPAISGAAINDGYVSVEGPKTDIDSISRVVAYVDDETAISETAVFSAELVAYDSLNRPIDSVSFVQAEDAHVSVTVPVMVYRKVELTPTVVNVPKGYENIEDLVTVSPSSVEIWGVPSELDEYIDSIQRRLVVNFDSTTPEQLIRRVALIATEGIHLLNGSETLELKVQLSNITSRSVEIPLTENNVRIDNCPEGYTVKIEQNKLPSLLLCGPKDVIKNIKPEEIVLVVDAKDVNTAGQQAVLARLELKEDTAWVCYSGAEGVSVFISVATE
ncbi:MAG: hypothetical protein IKU51_00915 [Clostridia bacterium]|nr:hypothetical protein [Clostridia bacterium]